MEGVILPRLGEAGFNLLLFIIAFALYINTFEGGYVWDDRAAIISNEDVHQKTTLEELFAHDFWGQNIKDSLSHKSYRPVTVLSFRFNHMLHGLESQGYHVTNVIIYGVVTVLVYELGKLWMSKGAARIASLLFCVHPVHVEAVASLVGRADSLCGLFYVSAVLSYVESMGGAKVFNERGADVLHLNTFPTKKGALYLGLALTLSLAASFSKEIGVTVFAVFLALEVAARIAVRKSSTECTSLSGGFLLCIEAVRDTIWARKGSMVRPSVVIVTLAVLMKLRTAINGETTVYEWTILENHIHHLPRFQERALSYGQSHFWYLFKLCFPRYLCFDYGFACIPTIHHLADIRNVLPALSYAAVLSLVCVAVRRVNVSLLLGIVLFIVPLLPALNLFLPVGTTLAERLLFLPSLGFCFIIGELLTGPDFVHVWQVWDILRSPNVRVPKGAVQHAFVALLSVLASVRVVTRNRDWNSELRIYESALEVCPLSAKALGNYAVLSLRDKTLHKSLISALTAIDVYKEQAPAFLNTGVVLQRLGFHARSAWYYKQSLSRRGGQRGKGWGYLGSSLYEWSLQVDKALGASEHLPSGGPSRPSILLQRMAEDALDEAIRSDFQPPSLYHTRGSLALDKADLEYAVVCFETAIHKSLAAKSAASAVPREDLVNEVLTYNQLGNALSQLGRNDEAIGAFQRGLDLGLAREDSGSLGGPETVSILVNLGSTLRAMGKLELARDTLSQGLEALERRGTAPPPALLNNLGLVHQDLGDLHAAALLLERAVAEHRETRARGESSPFQMRSAEVAEAIDDDVEATLQLNFDKARSLLEMHV